VGLAFFYRYCLIVLETPESFWPVIWRRTMVNPVIGVLAAAKVGTLAWWTIHLARTRSISKANRAVADDWDSLTGYGNEVVAFTKTIYGLNALEAKDFPSFVAIVRDSKHMLARFPTKTQKFLESQFHISAVLEEESRIAYVHYAAVLSNDESGDARLRIARLYRALHIFGRTDWPIMQNAREGMYIHLMKNHKKCKGKILDQALLAALERLQSSTVHEFESALGTYLRAHDRTHHLSTIFITHALMPLSCGTLSHGGIADEIVRVYGLH